MQHHRHTYWIPNILFDAYHTEPGDEIIPAVAWSQAVLTQFLEFQFFSIDERQQHQRHRLGHMVALDGPELDLVWAHISCVSHPTSQPTARLLCLMLMHFQCAIRKHKSIEWARNWVSLFDHDSDPVLCMLAIGNWISLENCYLCGASSVARSWPEGNANRRRRIRFAAINIE